MPPELRQSASRDSRSVQGDESLFPSLQLLVVLRYLLPALLVLFVWQAVRVMAQDLSRTERRVSAQGHTGPAELVVVQSPALSVGERFRLASAVVVIGRDPAADIRVEDPLVSGRHAELARHEGRLFLADLNSTNGTWVQERRVTAPVWLTSGDELTVGDTVFRFEQP